MIPSVEDICHHLSSNDGVSSYPDDEPFLKLLQSRQDLFSFHKNGRQTVAVYLKLYLCKNHIPEKGPCKNGNCQYFHTCKEFLLKKSCSRSTLCTLGHNITSTRNQAVLRRFFIINKGYNETRELLAKITERLENRSVKTNQQSNEAKGRTKRKSGSGRTPLANQNRRSERYGAESNEMPGRPPEESDRSTNAQITPSVENICHRLSSNGGVSSFPDDEPFLKLLQTRQDLFLFQKNGRQTVAVYLKLYLCKDHIPENGPCKNDDCLYFHTCKEFLLNSSCTRSTRCSLGHDLTSPRNQEVLKRFFLNDKTYKEIGQLLSAITEGRKSRFFRKEDAVESARRKSGAGNGYGASVDNGNEGSGPENRSGRTAVCEIEENVKILPRDNVADKNKIKVITDALFRVRGKFPALQLAERLGLSNKSLYELVLSSNQVFSLIISDQSGDLEVKLNMQGCVDYMKQNGCQNRNCDKFHVCAAHVKGMCQVIECEFEHGLKSGHNYSVLKKFGLEEESCDDILCLLSEMHGFCVIPSICEAYIDGDCQDKKCEFLHICIDFIRGLCGGKNECNMDNHDILSVQCQHALHCAEVPYSLSPRDLIFHAKRIMATDRRVIITDLVKALASNMGILTLTSLSRKSRIPLSQLNSLLRERPDLFLIFSEFPIQPLVSLNLELCYDYISGRSCSGCHRVHLCSLFLYGQCMGDEMCITTLGGERRPANHTVKTSHNIGVFRRLALRQMDDKDLVIVLMLNGLLKELKAPVSSLNELKSAVEDVCWDYISGKCDEEHCDENSHKIFQKLENKDVSAQNVVTVLRNVLGESNLSNRPPKSSIFASCPDYSYQRNCTSSGCRKLHVCLCSRSDCNQNHKLRTGVNKEILSEHGLLDLEDCDIFKIISKVPQSVNFPKICLPFNQGSCSDECCFLHVCLKNVLDLCSSGSCSVGPHDMSNQNCRSTLNGWRVPKWTTHKDLVWSIAEKMKELPEIKDMLYRDTAYKIVNALATNGFQISYSDLLASVDVCKALVQDTILWQPDLFKHDPKLELKCLIFLHVEICYLKNCVCDKLHACCKFLLGSCEKRCMISHYFKSKRNYQFLRNHFLDKLVQDRLKELVIFNMKNNPPPSLCLSFNYGSCTSKECCYLHLCLADVVGVCNSVQCWLPHLSQECSVSFDTLLQDLRGFYKQEAMKNNQIRQGIEDFIFIYPKVAEFLQSFDGEAALSEMADKLNMDSHNLEESLKRNTVSYKVDNTSDSKAYVRFNLSICSDPSCKSSKCEMLHVCWQYFLCGFCTDGETCPQAHNFRTDSNLKILRKAYLGKTTIEVLRGIVLKLCQLIPSICLPYNLGNCTSTDSACRSLHICVRPLLSLADTNCPAENHSISASHCKALLNSHKKLLSMNESQLLFLTTKQAVRQNMKEALKAYEFGQTLAEEVALAGGVKDFDVSVDGQLLQETLSMFPLIFSSAASANSIRINLKLLFCQRYASQQGCNKNKCQRIHLCKSYLGKSCLRRGDCRYSHAIKSSHNITVFKHFLINGLSADALCRLLSNLTGNFVTPSVCLQYNKGICGKTKCEEFHVCFLMMTGDCDDKFCKNLNHDITAPQCARIFEDCSVPMNQSKKELISYVWKNSKGNSNAEEYVKIAKVGCFRAHVYHEANVGVEEVCLAYLEKDCHSFKCPRLHSDLPYHWQIQSPNQKIWLNLPSQCSNALEDAFLKKMITAEVFLPCLKKLAVVDAFTEVTALLNLRFWHVTFGNKRYTMFPLANKHNLKIGPAILQSLVIRRLSTISSVLSNHEKATRWCWYYQDGNSQWTAYTQSQNEIEKEFLRGGLFLKLEHSCRIYRLSFAEMLQVDLANNNRQKLLRRPLSESDEEIPEEAEEVTLSELPTTWDTMTITEDFTLVQLAQKSAEYHAVLTEWFGTSRPNTALIVDVFRVQNRHLWEQYEVRKKHLMKTLPEDKLEHALFRGVSESNWSKSCKENFDSRMKENCDTGTYGAGVYFYKYFDVADSYLEEGPVYCMVLAKVLVGRPTEGDHTMIRPKVSSADPTVVFDTAVDNCISPNLYVKFQNQDFYPAYTVHYKKKEIKMKPSVIGSQSDVSGGGAQSGDGSQQSSESPAQSKSRCSIQ